MILRQQIGFVHLSHRLVPDAHLIASLTIGVILLRTTSVPCNLVELIGYGGSEADARKHLGQTSLRTHVILNPDRAVIEEMIGVVECESCQLYPLDI